LTRVFAARSGAMALLIAGLVVMAGLTTESSVQATGNGTVQINPSSQTVPGTFTVTIQTNTNVAISGAQSDYTFDQARLQVHSVVRGSVWNNASFVMGVAPQTHQQAIAEANTTGRLKNIGLFYEPGVGSVPTGTHTLVTITLRAIQCGCNTLGVSLGEILDATGDPATVSHTGGSANQTIDTDGDTICDGSDNDDDNDTWSDVAELIIGTSALADCGAAAWPPDINSDTFVDIIGDIAAVTNSFGQSVPPAPARHDIAPDPPNGSIGVIDDISRMAGLFAQSCT
jgi:hypothetical protein